jgi:hypothetical protein
MQNDRIIDENDQQEIENLWLKKILNVFAILSSGGVYNGRRWEPRADLSNPRPLLIHTGTLVHSLRNADVTWDGNDDFLVSVAERNYPQPPSGGQDVTTRDVFLFHQLGTETMPARPIIVELEKNDIEDIRRLIAKKTKNREKRFYQRWYDAFTQAVRFFGR